MMIASDIQADSGTFPLLIFWYSLVLLFEAIRLLGACLWQHRDHADNYLLGRIALVGIHFQRILSAI